MPRFSTMAVFCAFATAAANLGYSISFLAVRPDNPDEGGTAASAFLLVGGLLAVPVLLAIYRRLREREADIALLALLLGAVGAVGATIHGGYDLANAINPPGGGIDTDLPNQVDPRGLLTFGFASLGLLLVSGLIFETGAFPRHLAWLSGALGLLLLVVYVNRLVILEGDSAAIVIPAALAGFIVSPAWYLSLGLELRR